MEALYRVVSLVLLVAAIASVMAGVMICVVECDMPNKAQLDTANRNAELWFNEHGALAPVVACMQAVEDESIAAITRGVNQAPYNWEIWLVFLGMILGAVSGVVRCEADIH